MTNIRFDAVGKVYADGSRAVQDMSLEVSEGDFMIFVGPSGCGKTTALRMVAGLESVTEGTLSIGGRVVNEVEPRLRDVAMVFQNYALYPHMSVFENIAFPLRATGVKRAEVRTKVEDTAKLLGLTEFLRHRPGRLSGGQRQRVAMGRAIVRDPQVFLMDEPLSNLDAKLRTQMRTEIGRIQRDLGTTTIYVTHDQVEAMTMGTRIAVIRNGRLQQVGAADDLYDWPANMFVATFMGSPPMNLFTGRIARGDGGLKCVIGGARIEVDSSQVDLASVAAYMDKDLAVGIRPEDLMPSDGTNDESHLTGSITLVEALGAEQIIHFDIEAEPVMTADVLEVAKDIDASNVDLLAAAARDRTTSGVWRFSRRFQCARGDNIRLSAAPDSLRFFDLETGNAVGQPDADRDGRRMQGQAATGIAS